MSITRNRELSQFGSFIFVDNTSENIGITTEATPYVGIGTTNPTVKFEVVGDTNIRGDFTVTSGSINASSYNIDGNPLVDATLLQWSYASNGTDMYRLNGNIGIGTSSFSEKLTVLGNISAGQFISTVTSGTAPFVVLSDTQVTNLNASFLRGKIPPNGTIVGTTDSQTLTNKTLTSPIISSISNTGVITLPTSTTTLVGRNTTDTLTNKTIAAGSNTITGLTNANLSGSAGITTSNLAQYTISGVPLGNNLASLNFGGYINGSYNGSSPLSVSIAATSINTANTLVARDINGDFTAGTVNCSNLNVSLTLSANTFSANTFVGNLTGNATGLSGTPNIVVGIITCTDINSTSDINLKTNIKTVENSLETINQLRGVSFDWKETGKGSYGVIAQEIERVLPDLVNSGENKSVNYNGLIGILIEAIKELSDEVEELRKNFNK